MAHPNSPQSPSPPVPGSELNAQFLLAQAKSRLRFKRPGDAVLLLRNLINQESDHASAIELLGQTLSGMGQPIEGGRLLCRSYVLQDPRHQPPRMRGIACYILGEVGQAREIYRKWVRSEPDNPLAQHFYAAFSGENIPPRASDAFIRETFDGYAPHFDESLRGLNYHIPEDMSALLARHRQAQGRWQVLDGGCGTGMGGAALRPWAAHLTGVDLSEQMVARARQLNFYDRLVVSEIGHFLLNESADYDLIAFADTLIYFGELSDILRHTAKRLAAGGWLIFNTELPQAAVTADFTLSHSGRYQHRPAYVAQCLENAGLHIEECVDVKVRQEFDQSIAGQLVLARNTASGSDSGGE